MNMQHSLAVMRNEIRIGIRNRWVVLAALTLLAFALVLGFLGSAPTGDVKTGQLTIAIASLATLSVYLVPLLALLLAFDAIAGEVERGSLPLLLASPASRSSVILGKFAGHLAIVAIAIATGYGVAGAVIMAISGEGLNGFAHLVRLVLSSIALGAVFLAIGYVASAATRQAGTAAALSVGIWLIAVVLYDLALLGALIADNSGIFAKTVFPYLLAANPADAFRLYNIAALENAEISTGFANAASELPFTPETAIAGLGLWLLAALLLATFIFRRLEP